MLLLCQISQAINHHEAGSKRTKLADFLLGLFFNPGDGGREEEKEEGEEEKEENDIMVKVKR